jgi:GntR family transcriptional regulator
MGIELPTRQPPLSDQVYEIILKEISSGGFPPGSLLPSENQLAERFQVSRPTIRAAFARLAERGYVRRQRGVGTFVTESPSIMNPLYQFLDVSERIEMRGSRPGFIQLDAEMVQAGERIADLLGLPTESEVLRIRKVFTADDVPIIHFVNYIPPQVFQACLTLEQAMEPGATEPFFTFFDQGCSRRIYYLASIIRPQVIGRAKLPPLFKELDPDMPILVVEDVGFDNEDHPVFVSYEYLVGAASDFHVLRHVENI